MSVAGCLEFILCMGCARWACHRCSHGGSADSDSWSSAALTDFASVPRACRAILAVYETDLSRPRWAPKPHGYPVSVPSKRATRADTSGRCPPYLIYADAEAKEVVVAVRGLSLVKESDYKMLLDDRPGLQRYEEGYVHHGLWKAAVWLVNREGGLLRRMLREEGKVWRLVLAGHSLGAGVAALVAMLVVSNLEKFQGLERGSVRCYAVAPPRCMSLNLAVKYADVIHSVVLQDDFLPRTPTPLQHIFGSIFCLPCLLCFVCMRDTFVSEERKLKDPTRLYAPGRMFHIVERKFCRCGRLPPEVRTAIPVEGRFEHIVLSCNAITDHSIVSIEREAQKALDIMKEKEGANITPPMQRRMERERSFQAEHNDAMEKALLLSQSQPDEPPLWKPTLSESQHEASSRTNSSEGSEWDGLVEKPFDENDEPEDLIMQNDID